MLERVPTCYIFVMAILAVTGVAIPLLIMFFLKKRGVKGSYFFWGFAAAVVFSLAFEQIINAVIIYFFGYRIAATTLNKALYTGFLAALFDEFGKFIFLGKVIDKKDDNRNAVMFGAGFGMLEMVCLLSCEMISNLMFAIKINNGQFQQMMEGLDSESTEQMNTIKFNLCNVGWKTYAAEFAGKLMSFTIQVCLCVIVWYAVKLGGMYRLLVILSFALHMGINSGSVYISDCFGGTVAELVFLAFTVVMVVLTLLLYKKLKDKEPIVEE
nr:YhfC family intramembrane metalloprotease [Lachnospiraceae bacterium]